MNQVTEIEPIEELQQFEYEFSNLWEGRLYFVYITDTNIASAVERVICKPQTMAVTQNPVTGHWFFNDNGGTGNWCIKVQPLKPSFVLDTDCKPLPSEKGSVRKTNPTAEDILKGLL